MVQVHVHICKEFEDDLYIHHNIRSTIDKFIKDLQNKRPEEIQFEHVHAQLYLKRFFKKFRVVVQECRMNSDHVFYCLRKIFDTSKKDYDQFRQNEGVWLEANPMDEELRIEEIVPLQPMEDVPDPLKEWIDIAERGCDLFNGDIIIYESNEWFTKTQHTFFQEYWIRFFELLEKIVDASDHAKYNSQDVQEEYDAKNQVGILYRRYHLGERHILFLLDSLREPAASDHKSRLAGYYPVPTDKGKEGLDRVIAQARRGFPYYILCEQELWKESMREQKANLALSGEEEDLLKEARSPIFINGRAGSGKSTILYYLFSQYCAVKLAPQNPGSGGYSMEFGDPIFLTYSKKLLEEAQKIVTSIVRYNPNFGLAKSNISLDQYFKTFEEFVRSFLPPEELQNFVPEKYVSFARFEQIYHERCHSGKKLGYSLEFVWHTIRTFIKGYDVQEYLTPENYKEIGRKDRNISIESYTKIYNDIWKSWYERMQADGYWDDQDIIRHALKNRWISPKHPVIFCDEAQDFTRIELQFLLRTNLFFKYNLASLTREKIHIPFAFAGDPFQTINPTGFRWSQLQASFHDVVEELYLGDQYDSSESLGVIRLELQELKQNYRSTRSIVDFSNLIQYYRKFFTGEEKIAPQNTWFTQFEEVTELEKSPVPIFFVGSSIQDADIKQKPQAIIVPVDEDKIADYVQNDPILKKLAEEQTIMGEKHKEGKAYANIFSCMQIKGLELPRVLLYNFGQEAREMFHRLVECLNREKQLSESEEIEAAYFFNKLYVAATRAQMAMFIVDAQESRQDFWHYFLDQETIWGNNAPEKRQIWQEKINFVREGSSVEMGEMMLIKQEELRTLAENLRKEGESRQNPDFLEKAYHYYTRLEEKQPAQECKATVLKLRKKWLEAGRAYLALNRTEDARDCFWFGECWGELQSLACRGQHIYSDVANFMLEKSLSGFLDCLDQLESEHRTESNVRPKDPVWKDVVEKLVLSIKQEMKKGLASSEKKRIIFTLQPLARMGFVNVTEMLADICFFEKQYDRAIRLWEDLGKTSTPQYFEARAWEADNPADKISFFMQAHKNEEALIHYGKHEEMLPLENLELLSKLLYFIGNLTLEARKEKNIFEKSIKNLAELNKNFPDSRGEIQNAWRKAIEAWSALYSRDDAFVAEILISLAKEARECSPSMLAELFEAFLYAWRKKQFPAEGTRLAQTILSEGFSIAEERFWDHIIQAYETSYHEIMAEIRLYIVPMILRNVRQNRALWGKAMEVAFGSFEVLAQTLKIQSQMFLDAQKKEYDWPGRNSYLTTRKKVAEAIRRLDEKWTDATAQQKFCKKLQTEELLRQERSGMVYDQTLIMSLQELCKIVESQETLSWQVTAFLESKKLIARIQHVTLLEQAVFKIIAEIASSLQPEHLHQDQKRLIEELFIRRFLQWNEEDQFRLMNDKIFENVNFTEVGTMIEMISLYKTQVHFYHEAIKRLEDQNDPDQRNWVRRRIIYARRKWNQIPVKDSLDEKIQQNNAIQKNERIQLTSALQKKWGISESDMEMEREYPSPIQKWERNIQISGIPEEWIKKKQEFSYLYFWVEDFEIRVWKDGRVKVIQQREGTADSFDLVRGTFSIEGESDITEQAGNKNFSTKIYSGTLGVQTLELAIQRYKLKIQYSTLQS